MENESFDNLKILTKDQIIQFLKREYYLKAPSERTVKGFLWEIKSTENQKKREDHHKNGEWTNEAAKKADQLARDFNEEKDTSKSLEILKERNKLMSKIQNYYEEYKKIDKEYDKIEKLIQ